MENREYIMVAFTENQVGVLNRIAISYLRRKINIESLKVSESSIKGVSVFVISAITTEGLMQKIRDQIASIIEVIDVRYYLPDQLITQEIALYKVEAGYIKSVADIEEFCAEIGVRIIEIQQDYVVMEKSGTREEVEQVHEMLEKQGVLIEFTRSGSVILHKESVEEKIQHKMESDT